MTLSDLHVAAPELILAGSALLLLMWGAFQGRSNFAYGAAAVLALVAAAFAAALGVQGRIFSGGLIADDLSAFAKVFIYGFSALAIPLGERWLMRRGDCKFEFNVLIILAALGMGMMVSAGDLIALYIGIELQSLALYVLAAFRRDDAKASEAGLKYFVLGALSSGLLLYGSSLIYGFAGSTQFPVIAEAGAAFTARMAINPTPATGGFPAFALATSTRSSTSWRSSSKTSTARPKKSATRTSATRSAPNTFATPCSNPPAPSSGWM